jgi:hypothetical protein
MAPPVSQLGAKIDLALILAAYQKWLLIKLELGQISSLKG